MADGRVGSPSIVTSASSSMRIPTRASPVDTLDEPDSFWSFRPIANPTGVVVGRLILLATTCNKLLVRALVRSKNSAHIVFRSIAVVSFPISIIKSNGLSSTNGRAYMTQPLEGTAELSLANCTPDCRTSSSRMTISERWRKGLKLMWWGMSFCSRPRRW